MNPSPTSRLDQAIVRFTRQIIRWRWAVVLGTLIVTLGVASGAQGLFFNTNYNAFFSADNPQLLAYESLEKVYTRNDNILFVVAPKQGQVFTPDVLTSIEELTAESWKIPYAIRVDAITNFQHTYAEEDDLIVEDLVSDPQAQAVAQLQTLRAIALEEPLLRDRIIDPDAQVTGVNVTLQLPNESATEGPEAAAAARVLADQIREAHPEVDIYITGFAMLNNAFMEISQAEMGKLMPIMFGAMILIMIFSLRSVSGTIATMMVIGFSAMIAMGMAGFFKVGLTPPSAQAPTIIMTLAIADSIHILVTMLREMRHGASKYDAIVESIRVNFMPIFWTSISTVIGFLSLNFSDVPPFHHLGNMTAVGVTAAFVFSVTFLPAFVAILPIRAKLKTDDEKSSPLLERLADFVVLHHKRFALATGVFILISASFIPLNELDDRFVEYFDESIAFRTDSDFTAEHLTGIYQVEFSVEAGGSGSISDPAYLATIDRFAEWYREQPGVVHVNALTDVMKRLNKNMHGDDPAYYSLPEDRELAAQYLLLYEMSLPYGLDLNNQINVDKSATRFTVTLENLSAADVRATTEAGAVWLQENAPPAMHAVGSGAAVMFAYVSGVNINSMIQGSILALVLISFLMIFALRSVKLGLLSFIPNLLPAVVAFGIWGLLSGVVNIGLSIVIGMTMGIVVDDSIHFLSKYNRARREKGLNAPDAVRYAFSSVGRALIVTTVILVVGFMILSTSAFGMNASMGLMTAITILLALVVDFLFLPPLLIMLDSDKDTVDATAMQPAFAKAKR